MSGEQVDTVATQTESACPVCAEPMAQRGPDWRRVCPACRMETSTLAPRLDARPMAEMFDWRQREGALKALRLANFAALLDHLGQIRPPPARLLDIGCAEGWFLEAALARGYEVHGLEPDARMAASGAPSLNISEGFFPDALAERERFDIITFNDVFEHLPDTNATLAACRAHLAERGLLLINLPNAEGGIYRIAQLLDRLGMPGPFARMWQKDYPSPHLSYFTPTTLAQLAARHGFRERARHPLAAVRLAGLWSRIRYDRTQPWTSSAASWLGAVAALPLLKAMPSDISLQMFEKTPNGV